MFSFKHFLLLSFIFGTASAGLVFSRNPDGSFGSPSWTKENPSNDGVLEGMDNPVNHLAQSENSSGTSRLENPVNHFYEDEYSNDKLKTFMRAMDNPVNHLVKNENSGIVVEDGRRELVTGNSLNDRNPFNEDGHKHHFNGDGHSHEFNDDGHVLHFNGDGHQHQFNQDVFARHFSGNGYLRKVNKDNHNHHFNKDGHAHKFNDNGHVLHFYGDGHLHSLHDERLINGNQEGNHQRQLSDAFLAPPPKSMDHVVKAPLDDDDLSLVQETFNDQTINKTGQLRYSTLPIVEKALVKDIVRIILKDEEYMILLNNPSFPEVVNMVKTMLREPIQDVLQQQIWSKVLAIEAYYKKFYQPLNNPETKREAMNFLTHLKEASDGHKLTVDDTVKLNEEMQTLAYLVQEKEFNQRISDLEATIKEEGETFKEKHYSRKNAMNNNSSTIASAPVTVNATTVKVITTTTPSNASTTDTSVRSSYNASLPTTDASLISTTTNSTTTESIYTGTNATVTSNTSFGSTSAVWNVTTTEQTPSTNSSKTDSSSIRRNFAESFNPYVGGPNSVGDSWNPEGTDEDNDY
ncbi:hypothetical protein L3Y34_012772 [Caenorhabditis briggsae]|uniref:Uncharacterized protein n=1 Tax=Caenorhabditis briggsae TaxID=6238 RepID=A0AAE9CVK7_CAEBR|nr:hypothetical protein L3Y34_012772 [Caenorhabditis briggsae]